jgi:hypothetical protein
MDGRTQSADGALTRVDKRMRQCVNALRSVIDNTSRIFI